MRNRRSAIGAMLAALVISLGLLAAPAAQANSGAKAPAVPQIDGHQIINQNSGNCLVVRTASSGAGAIQFDCLSYADQFWQLEYRGNGQYWIRNTNSNMCLASQGARETQLVQQPCAVGPYRTWTFWARNAQGYNRMANVGSGYCAVARNTLNDGPVVQTDCAEFRDQYWYLPGL